jgi:pimeloyl-ACP methyl ester carboxylesterase
VHPNSKRRAVRLGLGLGFVLVRIALGDRVRQNRHHFRYSLSSEPDRLPGEAREYKLVELETEKGVRLHGALRLPASKESRGLLMFPGNSETQLSAFVPVVERLRADRDFGCALFNYRGFDGSGGSPGPDVADKDALAQVRYLREQHGIAPEQLVLSGYSMGSGIALRLSAALARAGTPAKGLALMSPYFTLHVVRPTFYGLVVPPHEYTVDDALGELLGPVLVVAGARDFALPVAEHARPLVARLGKRARYIELPDKEHVDYLGDEASLAPILEFVGREPIELTP